MALTKEDSCWGEYDISHDIVGGRDGREVHAYFKGIIDRIEYRPEWRKKLTLDGDNVRFYFQWEWDDKCNFSGKPMLSRSAKYYLSPHMTETEVVNRIFLAAIKAEEHETREKFRYRPEGETEMRAPYNTHISVNALWGIGETFDTRS